MFRSLNFMFNFSFLLILHLLLRFLFENRIYFDLNANNYLLFCVFFCRKVTDDGTSYNFLALNLSSFLTNVAAFIIFTFNT